LNALNAALLGELSDALDQVVADEDIRVLVLTGAGDKAFVAGADISELATFNPLSAKHFAQKGQAAINKLQNLPIVVIAAVNGFALGGGTEIAIACDFIYASENAKFGQPEINLGLIPGFGGTQRLPRLIGTLAGLSVCRV
jgi:enoyl-CoA hydratase